jgi:DNA-binding LytR/AlgR family response regulator
MLHAIIIEDEQPALANLVQVLHEVEPQIMIESTLRSVKEGVAYLSTPRKADIIFSDVQLSDGLSFDIFKTTATEIPVVFITGYDSFVMNSFNCNGIDYLLKPVNKNDLRKAISKYEKLGQHFAGHSPATIAASGHAIDSPRLRSRIIVRRGAENISLKLSDVALFYSEHKVVYVVDRNGKKYMGDRNLTDLEAQLDPTQFFRANRQFIINIEYIRGFRAYERVRLQVDIAIPESSHCVIVSQETAPLFRRWMYGGM